MFGIGKLLGNVAGGLLDKVGLGKIAPFVKMGLNALTGNWLGVAQDVFGLVSNFKGNFLDKAATEPPLGGFEQPLNNFAGQNTSSLGTNRMADLFKGLSDLFRSLSGENGNNNDALGGFGKILNAFKAIGDLMGNNQLFANRSASFQYFSMRS